MLPTSNHFWGFVITRIYTELRQLLFSNFSVSAQTDRQTQSTQPGRPLVGRRNEYQPKGGDALRLGSKGMYGSCVGGR